MELLPDSWTWVTASEVCSSVRDGTHDTPKYVESGIPLVTSKNLCPGGLDLDNVRFISLEDHREIGKRSGVNPGDVLFAMIGTIGNPVVVRTNIEFSIKNVGLFKKNPTVIDSDYLMYWLSSSTLMSLLHKNELIKGTTQRFIPLGHLRELPIPFAPLNEQKRIVAEIEKQFTRLDAAVANLHRVQTNLQRYKASVLKAACEGRLVPQEATLNPDYEPAAKLLERILAERRRKWEEDEWQNLVERAQKKVAQSQRKAAGLPHYIRDLEPEDWQDIPESEYRDYLPKNDKWKQKYEEPQPPDTDELPELPEGWVWIDLNHIAFVTKLAGFEYTKFVNYVDDGDLPVVKAENVKNDGFQATDFSYVDSETVSHLTRSKLEPFDLLMVFVGVNLGNVALLPADKEYFLGPNVAIIRLESATLLPEFVEIYLRSPIGIHFINRLAKATAQGSISMGSIRQIPVAVPSIAEQKRIITEAQRRLSTISVMKQAINTNTIRSDRLRQSILQQAFNGKLVLQNPDDEPAAELLKRGGSGKGQTDTMTQLNLPLHSD